MRKHYKVSLLTAFAPIVLSSAWVTVASLTYTSALYRIDSENSSESVDAIVVLTGDHQRIREGRRLHTQNNEIPLLISGVDKTSPLRSLKNEFLGLCALDTIGNAIETRRWILEMSQRGYNIRSILLVTSHSHMPRSLVEFKRQLPHDINIRTFPVKHNKFKKFEKEYEFIFESNKTLLSKLNLSQSLRGYLGRPHIVARSNCTASLDIS